MKPSNPTPLKPQQEKFVRLLAEGMTQQAAYEAAGYAARGPSADKCASVLLRNGKVSKRLAEVQEEMAYASQVTVGYISRELRKVYHLAVAEKQTGGATAALMGLAKLHGFLWDRQQIEMIVRKPSADPDAPDAMTETEWAEKYGSPTLEIDHQRDPVEPAE